MATPIGTLGTIPSINVNGRVLTDMTNLITLVGFITTAGHYATFRLPNGSAGYAVTGGKTFTVAAMWAATPSTSSGPVTIGYGNTDVGLDSASAPSSPIYYGGGAAGDAGVVLSATSSGLQPNLIPPAINFTIPAGKYPVFYSGATGARVVIYGYET